MKSLSKAVDYSYVTKVSLIHRWLSNSSPEGDDERVFNNPLVHWCHNVCGPVGNSGGCHQKSQQSFNSVKWLESQGAAPGGFIIHTGEYVNCIQIIGNQEQSGIPFNTYVIILWSMIIHMSWIGLLSLTVTDISTTCAVVIFRVKVSCITSVDGIIFWLLTWLVN